MQKEIDTISPFVLMLEKKLSNEEFVNNAPAMVIEKERQKLKEAKDSLEKCIVQLQQLS